MWMRCVDTGRDVWINNSNVVTVGPTTRAKQTVYFHICRYPLTISYEFVFCVFLAVHFSAMNDCLCVCRIILKYQSARICLTAI